MEKVSVITVVFNDVKHIKDTMESFFSQTYENKEYIVIDGGSTDGTKEIIECYADRLAYWCSEPDGGIYDAMNKGISHATGDWINFLNCGDRFCADDTIEKVMDYSNGSTVDVIYGNAIADNGIQYDYVNAGTNLSQLEFKAIYRHGCSFMKTEIQKKFLYDTSKSNKFGFALDYDAIYRMYHAKCNFLKVPIFIQTYLSEGASNNITKSLKYNYRITTQYEWSSKKLKYYLRHVINYRLKHNTPFKLLRLFIYGFFLNSIMPCIPSWSIRKSFYKLLSINVGKGSVIDRRNYFLTPKLFSIGEYSHINRDCILDARGGIHIGNSVSISCKVNIITGSHDVNSKDFHGIYTPIIINDFAWLGIGCTILQGVTIGKGAVVCAGAIVTKDVSPYEIVAGVPARKIGIRSQDLDYKCIGIPLL